MSAFALLCARYSSQRAPGLPASPQCWSAFTYEGSELYICPECAQERINAALAEAIEDTKV
ncbi:hypothetical protein [Quatrionicoccus australiensis]|uniref:hypothetical protein n=1 Tax=Quatrionicoccus australiensis TaxID=138118 RepID=UPI00384C2AB5